jgi:hypothetical protein
MAWNPSPQVAVARDAAQRLGNAKQCIVIYLTDAGQIGYASYGRTKQLCDEAKGIADAALEGATDYLESRL